MNKRRRYFAELKHDGGTVRVYVTAANVAEARELIKTSEKCPDGAIQWIGPEPTARELKRTRAWLGGMR